MDDTREKTIYELFRLSIWLKALGSVGEILAGAFIAFVPTTFILHTALLLTQGDIDGDADDFLAHGILNAAHSFSISNDLLIGIYIFVRGLVQLIIVFALFKNKRWAYPALLVVLLIIVGIQSYEIYLSHSLATAVITLIDLITIGLVWHEYGVVRGAQEKSEKLP